MNLDWFKPRSYQHFDRPVCEAFASKVLDPTFVARHSWTPLIHYTKQTKKYKNSDGKTLTKDRPIMYASHRDACILSMYASVLGSNLDIFYREHGLNDQVIAYRTLGRSNYDFSAEVLRYADAHAPCTILAFDVSGFFDNLDHALLKKRLKRLLGVDSLSTDWHCVLKSVTKYHFVDLAEIEAHPTLGAAVNRSSSKPIASVAALKAAGLHFHPNKMLTAGIPQGTPISAPLANLYMMDFDTSANTYCQAIGALYRRYSDDILVICPPDKASEVRTTIENLIEKDRLTLSAAKTEVTHFDPTIPRNLQGRSAQYLGFTFYPGGAGIRPNSLGRQWRKMRRSIKRAERAAEVAVAAGKPWHIYTKQLRRRFSPLQFRNFSSYARRSASAFGQGEKISGQVKRIEREFDRLVRALKVKASYTA